MSESAVGEIKQQVLVIHNILEWSPLIFLPLLNLLDVAGEKKETCWVSMTSIELCRSIGDFFLFPAFYAAVSPSDNSRTFGLSPVWPLDAPSHKQANGDLRLGTHWRPQSPKSPKSPKVLRLSPQESRCVRVALLSHTYLQRFNLIDLHN